MKLPIVTRPVAAGEFESAYRWYENQRLGLGEEFLQAANDLVNIIAEHSERFPIVHRDIRRAVLHRFPYSIFYRLKRGHVIVTACFHQTKSKTMDVSSLSKLSPRAPILIQHGPPVGSDRPLR